MAKRKPTLEDAHAILLVAETAATIKAQDCAAYSVLVYHDGNAPDEWQRLGVEALGKFARFGWAMFHALGGLNLDWDKASENAVKKLRTGLPKQQSKAKRPPKRAAKGG